jgi:molybdopterin/thiamine biosynthesis adenylyltransferase
MDLTKSFGFFKPYMVRERLHIIGCGSVGSTLALMLTQIGLTKFSLYDFDVVESHNLTNQAFLNTDIKRPKVEALKDIICSKNPDAINDIRLFGDGWTESTKLNGYVFLCVDNIETRRKIATENLQNAAIKAVIDFRTGLTEAQCYGIDWKSLPRKNNYIKTTDFTHESAKESTPVSACGRELGVAPTVYGIVTAGVSNFINYVKGGQLTNINMDVFNFVTFTF